MLLAVFRRDYELITLQNKSSRQIMHALADHYLSCWPPFKFFGSLQIESVITNL